jgi:hypothetical protein
MEKTPFLDHAAWESIKRGGDVAIERWINSQLVGASVTAVLIGSETSQRKFVRYELKKSWEQKMGILGIYIHNCKDQRGLTDYKGTLDFGINFIKNGVGRSFAERFNTYDWYYDDGRNNIEKWIEKAASDVGR